MSCREQYALSSLSYAFPYEDDAVQALIHALKYQGVTEIAELLSGKLAEIVGFYPFRSSWVVVPVPLHWQRKNERGYNQAELLAEGLAKRLDLPVYPSALNRTRYTKSQVGFTREDRQKNLRDVFMTKDTAAVQDKNILLVDDVATTLTTLNSCAEALRGAGARNIWGVVVARAKP